MAAPIHPGFGPWCNREPFAVCGKYALDFRARNDLDVAFPKSAATSESVRRQRGRTPGFSGTVHISGEGERIVAEMVAGVFPIR